MVVSKQVIIEADRALTANFQFIQENRQLWKHLTPEIAPDPAISQTKLFLEKLPNADAAIYAPLI